MSFNGLQHFFFNHIKIKIYIKNPILYSIPIYPTSFVPIFQTRSYVTSKFQLKISILIKSISRYLSLSISGCFVRWTQSKKKRLRKVNEICMSSIEQERNIVDSDVATMEIMGMKSRVAVPRRASFAPFVFKFFAVCSTGGARIGAMVFLSRVQKLSTLDSRVYLAVPCLCVRLRHPLSSSTPSCWTKLVPRMSRAFVTRIK